MTPGDDKAATPGDIVATPGDIVATPSDTVASPGDTVATPSDEIAGPRSADEDGGAGRELVRGPVGTAITTRAHAHRLRFVAAAAIVLAALGFLIVKGLGNATLYFKTADEAVAQHDQLGTRRFRIEGVVTGPPAKQADGLHFFIENNSRTVAVVHTGDEPAMFQANIPVVLEGHFAAGAEPVYLSDRILVKHTANYTERHADRVKDYQAPSGSR